MGREDLPDIVVKTIQASVSPSMHEIVLDDDADKSQISPYDWKLILKAVDSLALKAYTTIDDTFQQYPVYYTWSDDEKDLVYLERTEDEPSPHRSLELLEEELILTGIRFDTVYIGDTPFVDESKKVDTSRARIRV